MQEREEVYQYCSTSLRSFGEETGCRLLEIPDNPISLAIALDSLPGNTKDQTLGLQYSHWHESPIQLSWHGVNEFKRSLKMMSIAQVTLLGDMKQRLTGRNQIMPGSSLY